jgi:hypothetical protein
MAKPTKPTQPTASEIESALRKRGFKMMGAPDPCPSCQVQSFTAWTIAGRTGGRQILWCASCNHSASFRVDAQAHRVGDPDFALMPFLGLGG